MEEKVLEKYKLAGKIGAEVRKEVLGIIKPGMKLLDIAEFIEKGIRDKGGEPAFPVNTSLNELAAHYVAQGGDTTTVEKGDLLKIDIGVHVDGYISDSAFTYCSEKSELAKSAEKSIEAAVEVIKPGVQIGEISKAIEGSISGDGFGVIVNLTGHGLEHNMFHAPPTIPNTATGSSVVLEEGQVIALEPFVAESNGHVKDSAPVGVYRFIQERPVRSMDARKILGVIQEKFGPFPFAKRWLYKDFSPVKVAIALKQLEVLEAVEGFSPLKEASGKRIAQAEHTIIVLDTPIVTTKL